MPQALPLFPQIPWQNLEQAGPRILLVNPWIHDFAAFNLWSRPVGLMACLHMLRKAGCAVAWLDCLDRTWQDMAWPEPAPDGRGHYPKHEIDKPIALAWAPRRFSRYGLPYPAVAEALSRMDPAPELIMVGSGMTYWYPGALAALELCREILPKVPRVLGGAYPTLCPEHAAGQDSADLVVSGPLENPANWAALFGQLGQGCPEIPEGAGLTLAQDVYPAPIFAPVLSSRGCPFACAYCASKLLYPGFKSAELARLKLEVSGLYAAGVRNFAFYDDALLLDFAQRLGPLLEHILSQGLQLSLHTPNAVHAASLSPQVCRLLRAAGLRRLRIGLESLDFSARLDRKLGREDFEQAMRNLLQAGFAPEEIGLNLLFQLPDQDMTVLAKDISYLRAKGFQVHLSDYSPIPGTALFAKAQAHSPLDLAGEPLNQNNSLWPCNPGGFTWDEKKYWHNLLTG